MSCINTSLLTLSVANNIDVDFADMDDYPFSKFGREEEPAAVPFEEPAAEPFEEPAAEPLEEPAAEPLEELNDTLEAPQNDVPQLTQIDGSWYTNEEMAYWAAIYEQEFLSAGEDFCLPQMGGMPTTMSAYQPESQTSPSSQVEAPSQQFDFLNDPDFEYSQFFEGQNLELVNDENNNLDPCLAYQPQASVNDNFAGLDFEDQVPGQALTNYNNSCGFDSGFMDQPQAPVTDPFAGMDLDAITETLIASLNNSAVQQTPEPAQTPPPAAPASLPETKAKGKGKGKAKATPKVKNASPTGVTKNKKAPKGKLVVQTGEAQGSIKRHVSSQAWADSLAEHGNDKKKLRNKKKPGMLTGYKAKIYSPPCLRCREKEDRCICAEGYQKQ